MLGDSEPEPVHPDTNFRDFISGCRNALISLRSSEEDEDAGVPTREESSHLGAARTESLSKEMLRHSAISELKRLMQEDPGERDAERCAELCKQLAFFRRVTQLVISCT